MEYDRYSLANVSTSQSINTHKHISIVTASVSAYQDFSDQSVKQSVRLNFAWFFPRSAGMEVKGNMLGINLVSPCVPYTLRAV